MRLISTLLLLVSSLLTQAQEYNFISYTVEKGLAQNQVLAITQDPSGYLWFGTTGGLSRFDGKDFKNFSQRDGLYRNQVNALFVDQSGKLWIASNGGVSVYDGTLFKQISFGEKYVSSKITSIAQSDDGAMWFATDDLGIIIKTEDGFSYINTSKGLKSNNVRSIFKDKKGLIWIGTKKGLNFFRDQAIYGFQNPDLDTSISHLSETNTGDLLVCTFGKGVFKIDNNSNITNYTSQNGLISDWVRQSFTDTKGTTWFVTKYGVQEFKSSKIIETYTTDNGLPFDNIRCLLRDNEGNMWFGSNGKGALKFSGKAFLNYTDKDVLADNIIMSIVEDRDGVLWLGTYETGVIKFKNQQLEVISTEQGLSSKTVWSALIDKKGRKWFGTARGLNLLDNGRLKTFLSSDPQGLSDGKITAIHQARDGKIWFGSRNGISHYKEDSTFVNYDSLNGFFGSNIRSIAEDKNGHLWCGADEGLFKFDPKNETTEKISLGESANQSKVLSIVITPEQDIWCGTDNGLFLKRGDNFKYITIANDARANFINFLLHDPQGLWIGTNYGIFLLEDDGKDFKFKSFTSHEGIKNLECNLNAAHHDRNGYYWFGTAGGLVRLDKTELKINSGIEQKVSLRSVKLFNEDTDWSKYADVDKNTGLPKNLILSHNKNTLHFDFNLFNFSNPEGVQYKYILEGFDEQWSSLSSERTAIYRRLPPGDYTFKVKAKNSAGEWSEPTVFKFTIKPPFWQTTWFLALCVIGFVCLVIAVVIWRKSVSSRKRETEQLKYRNKLLALEHQSLNASLNRHFIFNALNSIQYYINRQDRISANKYLSSFAKLIRKNLDSASSGGNYVTLAEEIDRIELYLSLEHMRFANKFEYSIDYKQKIDLESIMVPAMMLQPFIENSIWHGILPLEKPGKITLTLDRNKNGDIHFEISDNGIGIDKSLENKLKNGGTHDSKGMKITSGRIQLLKTITQKNISLKGPFQLVDEHGNSCGTKVEITIPANTMETFF